LITGEDVDGAGDSSSSCSASDCVPDEFRRKVAPAKGSAGRGAVRIEVRAYDCAAGKSSQELPLRYARMALLETLPVVVDGNDDESNEYDTVASTTAIQKTGIQVLNLVLFPPKSTTLPVWGADFVSLPGNPARHLLLLDAQPMCDDRSYEPAWRDWYDARVGNDDSSSSSQLFPWGGDMPEPVQRYVSKYALWTRFGANKSDNDTDEGEKVATSDPIATIQGPLVRAVEEHLDVYLDVLRKHSSTTSSSGDDANVDYQKDYVRYRLENDPARPMLRSLFGEEWTEQLLSRVLFPQQHSKSAQQ